MCVFLRLEVEVLLRMGFTQFVGFWAGALGFRRPSTFRAFNIYWIIVLLRKAIELLLDSWTHADKGCSR